MTAGVQHVHGWQVAGLADGMTATARCAAAPVGAPLAAGRQRPVELRYGTIQEGAADVGALKTTRRIDHHRRQRTDHDRRYRGDKVRLGIEAPADISVHRKEVFDAIQRENRKAAGVTTEDLATLPPKRGAGPSAK
jgi:hypothetical protein